jgi:hypothetical protein
MAVPRKFCSGRVGSRGRPGIRYIDNRLASRLGSLGRLGWVVIRISLPRLRVLRDPLNGVMFRNKTLDHFRFAIGP